MTIVEKIKNSVTGVLGKDYPVYYHDEPTLNLKTGKMDFPCCIVYLITTGNADKEAGQVKEQVSAALFFVRLMEGMAFDADDNEEIIDLCKKDAFAWYKSLNENSDIEMVSLIRTSRIYEEFDDIVTGFGMLCELRELAGFCNTTDNSNQQNQQQNG